MERYQEESNQDMGNAELSAQGRLLKQTDEFEDDIYCSICDKEFRSINQLANHFKAKTHLKRKKEILAEIAS